MPNCFPRNALSMKRRVISAEKSTEMHELRKDSLFSVLSRDQPYDSNDHQSYVVCNLNPSSAIAPLHDAIQTKDHQGLQNLLNDPKNNVEYVRPDDGSGKRPLHIAAEINDVTAVEFLFNHHADLWARQKCFYGLQPIHVAAAKGSLEVLAYLIASNNNLDVQYKMVMSPDNLGATPLHWAVRRHHVASVRYLLEHGATIDCKQSLGYQATPVHLACEQGSVDLVRLMAECRPSEFKHALQLTDAEASTPLHKAAALEAPELVEFLLSQGASLNEFDQDGRSPLGLASSRGAWKTLSVLLKGGADPTVSDPICRRTMFHHAAIRSNNHILSSNTFSEMLKQDPKWKQCLNAVDLDGYSALIYAARHASLNLLQGLLLLGASSTVKSKKERTVLHELAKIGNIEMVLALFASAPAADILNEVDFEGRTAIHTAAIHGHHEIVDLLISKGAHLSRDDCGQFPLHLAAAKNRTHVMKVLVSHHRGILNATDKNGRTALHVAAINDAGRAVAFLVSIGAKYTTEGSGRTPMDLAILHKKENAAIAFINSSEWKTIVCEPSSDFTTIPLGLIEHLPDVMKVCLDRCVLYHPNNIYGESYIEYDFSILQPMPYQETTKSKCSKQRYSPMQVLKTMSTTKRRELLSHPVCTTLLERKWIIYGLYCSMFILFFNMLLVGLLSYVLMNSVTDELYPRLLATSYDNLLKHSPDTLNRSEFQFITENFTNYPPKGFKSIAAIVILAFALLFVLGKEIMDLASQRVRYFRDWTNYFELMLFFSSVGFLFSLNHDNYYGTVGEYTYQFGAVAIFLAFFNLMRFCRPFGTFGLYSLMFFSTCKTLFKVSLFFFILIAAFTGAFSTIFKTFIFPDDPEFYKSGEELSPEDIRTPHFELWSSGVRVASLMLGDLEAVERFINPYLDGKMAYPTLSFLFYNLCLVLMSVLLNNLLMGLAIGDMAGIRRNAANLHLRMQVTHHEALERLFPASWVRHIVKKTKGYRYYPGKPTGFATYIARLASGGIIPTHTAGSLNEFDPEPVLPVDKNDAVRLAKRLRDLETGMADQRQLLVQILNRLEHAFPENHDPAKVTLV